MRVRFAVVLLTGGFRVLAADVPARPAEYVEGEVLVIFKTGVAAANATTVPGHHLPRLTKHYERISAKRGCVCGLVRDHGRSTAELIGELKADPAVAAVEPNYIRHILGAAPDDTEFPKLWALENTGQSVNGTVGTGGVDTKFLAAWKLARPANGEVVVGLVDTGVDISHPDLQPNIWVNPLEIAGNGIDDDGNGYADDVSGYDFASGDADVMDAGLHGTHVAGTIAAVGRNGIGVIGMDYRAKVLPLKVSKDGRTLQTSAIMEALNYVIALKERGVNIPVLNASFGSSITSVAEQSAVEALGESGIILCAGAGNLGDNSENKPFYPASLPSPNIISVAALSQNNALTEISNYGAVSVDLAAPGENIYSTKPITGSPLITSVIAGPTHAAVEISNSGRTSAGGVSGIIHHCGQGNAGDFPDGIRGNIALIQRGTITFTAKVTNAMNAGAAAAVIYDNTADSLTAGTWTLDNGGNWIPALHVTRTTGEAILAQLPSAGKVLNVLDTSAAYRFDSGTSMATASVSGAVAFAALNFPAETVSQRIARILDNVTPVAALSGKTKTGGRLNLLNIVDTDANHLPDWWEKENFGALAQSADADSDGDGFSNIVEFLAATNPVHPASHLSFTLFAAARDSMGNHFSLTFPSVEDRTYHIEWSGTLQRDSWSVLGSAIPGTGSPIEVIDSNAIQASPKRFYRLRLDPE